MKTIAILGGMGPQASSHANQRLISKLKRHNKQANIIHITLNIEPFYASQPKLELSNHDKELLWLN